MGYYIHDILSLILQHVEKFKQGWMLYIAFYN